MGHKNGSSSPRAVGRRLSRMRERRLRAHEACLGSPVSDFGSPDQWFSVAVHSLREVCRQRHTEHLPCGWADVLLLPTPTAVPWSGHQLLPMLLEPRSRFHAREGKRSEAMRLETAQAASDGELEPQLRKMQCFGGTLGHIFIHC